MVIARFCRQPVLIPALLLGTALAAPAAGASEGYTLRDLELLALRADAGIASIRARLDEAQGRLEETRSRFGPELSAYYSRYPTGGDLPEEEGRVQQWLSLGVRQDYVELLKVKPDRLAEMDAGVEGARALLQEAERQALHEIRTAYVDLVEAALRADHFQRLASIYEELFDIQNRRCISRTDLRPALLEVRKSLIEAEGEHQIHLRATQRRRELLAGALGIDPEEIVVEMPDPPPTLPSEEVLAALARRNRGEIRMLEANARTERARADASSWEDVHLSSFVGYRLRDDGVSGAETGLGVGVTFSMPLGFLGLRNGRQDRFLSRERHWRAEARRAVLDLGREIHRAYLDYTREIQRSLLAENGVRLASEELRIERLRFAHPVPEHESDIFTLREMEARLVAREMEHAVSRCAALRACYDLLYLAGVYFPDEISGEVDRASVSAPEVPDLRAAPLDVRAEWTTSEAAGPGAGPGTAPVERANGARLVSLAPVPDRPPRVLPAHGYPYGVRASGGMEVDAGPARRAVQVAVLSSLRRAQRLALSLKEAGWFAYIVPYEGDAARYRVRVGFFDTEEDAAEAGRKISAAFDIPDIWLTIPPPTELSRTGGR
jgi:outer membrane protein TolC